MWSASHVIKAYHVLPLYGTSRSSRPCQFSASVALTAHLTLISLEGIVS